jgi:cytidylate kinase
MAIITIYQGASGSGEELAQELADSLGYDCVDREVLVEASLRYGIPEAQLNHILERDPNWWQRFLADLTPYRLALQAAFCEIIQARDRHEIVYHGHLGHELVPHFKHVVRVLLTAPLESRIEQVRARFPQFSMEAARRYIEEVDRARSRRLVALFDADWRDTSRYDLVLNVGRMRVAAAKRLIVETVNLEDYQPTPASKQIFEDFALATRVRAILAFASDVPRSRLDVKATRGRVAVSGTIPSWASEDIVVTKIKQISGVKAVEADIVNLPFLSESEWP